MGAQFSNVFWRESIEIFAEITNEIQFARPYFFYNFNVFDNSLFSINNTELKSSDFALLWKRKICQAGDFFDCTKNPPELLSLNKLNKKYSLNLNFLNYQRLKEVIKTGIEKSNYEIFGGGSSDLQYPRLPL